MFPCNKCPHILTNSTDLIKHLKTVHQVRKDWYTCSLCSSNFNQLWIFNRHAKRCVKKKELRTRKAKNERVFQRAVNKDVQECRKLSYEAALDFGCILAGNMNVPRNSVYDVIGNNKNFVSSIADNMKNLVTPWVKEENLHEFENAVSIMKKSLNSVDTEHKLDKRLSSLEYISPLKKIKLQNLSKDPLMITVENETEEASEIEYDDNSHDSDSCYDGSYKIRNSEFATLMPINFQIKSFFELPNVYEKIMLNTIKIEEDNKLNHFINGKLWKTKLQNFSKDDVVIPYHLHIDDTQTNNALGTHTKNGNQTCVYYSFPTIPQEYIARLDNIFTALLFESSLSEKYGNERCYDDLVLELNKLADDGIVLNINGKEQRVYFVLGLLLGDNKGLNYCLGFTTGFTANFYCRLCRLKRQQMQFMNEEVLSSLRDRENYFEDLIIGNMSHTGLWEDSVFNKIRYYHATDGCVDVMHDINEGIIHYNLCEVILYFIKNKYFTLKQLNEEKRNLKYGDLEENNTSCKIYMKRLQKKKLKMTASESYAFAHHLPFILLKIIKNERVQQLTTDEVWRFLLTTIRFIDMSYMSCYDSASIDKLRKVIGSMNEMYVRLFQQTLKPKHHFATHYPSMIEKCGPLRFLSSMRYEAHHRFIKNYTKNTISRKNISYSVGRKLQYNFASILKNGVALNDHFTISKPKLTRLIDEKFYASFTRTNELEFISDQSLYMSEKVQMNGLTLSSKLFLPLMEDNELKLLKIMKIMLLSKDDPSSIRIVCQKFAKVTYHSLYGGYSVKKLRPKMHLINISAVLSQRIFPVVLHRVLGLNMFRYKTF